MKAPSPAVTEVPPRRRPFFYVTFHFLLLGLLIQQTMGSHRHLSQASPSATRGFA
ncbi:UNVERIFIED_CONTAM: hypothetical protein Sradi_2350600 [Sesamum radiatum]|uniref:Uncharacterized protein n=1 Tax=Sesamum radiatum TaxID=300843 RepID=A0AAW2T671_SESRA